VDLAAAAPTLDVGKRAVGGAEVDADAPAPFSLRQR